MPNGLRVFVADLGNLPAEFTQRLEQQGFAIVGLADSGQLASAVGGRPQMDVVLLFARHVDQATLSVVETLAGELRKPMAMFCEEADRAAIQAAVTAGVNAFAVTGVTGSRVEAVVNLALANHSCTVELKDELDEAKQALRERRVIERAKGIVMARRNLAEGDAYALLRSRAMERGMRLVDVASALVEADDLIG